MSTHPCVSSSLQNKNTLWQRAFIAKPRLVAGIEFPLLSTEIICQDGFCLGFAVTSRINPIQRIFTQLIYNIKFVKQSQAFEQTFFNFLKKFFHTLFIPFSLAFYTHKNQKIFPSNHLLQYYIYAYAHARKKRPNAKASRSVFSFHANTTILQPKQIPRNIVRNFDRRYAR